MRFRYLLVVVLLLTGCEKLNRFLQKNPIGEGKSSHPWMLGGYDDKFVLLVAGQSNAVQPLNGASPTYSWTGQVYVLYKHENIVPVPTVPTQSAPFQHNKAWVGLGDYIYNRIHKPVYIINVAFGNTSTTQWQQYIPELRDAVREWKPDAVLWVQGESDLANGVTYDDAYQNMKNIINASRAEMPLLQWFVALDGAIAHPEYREQSAVRRAQRQLINNGSVNEGPDIDKLRWEHPSFFSEMNGNPPQAEFIGNSGHSGHADAWWEIIRNRLG